MSQQPPFKKKNIPHLIQMKISATNPMAEFVIERYHVCVGYVPEAYRTVYMGKFITALETSQPSSRHKLRHKVLSPMVSHGLQTSASGCAHVKILFEISF
jgi:hypothetical protein